MAAAPAIVVEEEEIEAQDPAVEEAQFNLLYHPDGSPKMLTICRVSGAGEREIPAYRWPEFANNSSGTRWLIVRTEVVARGHSAAA